MINHPERSVVSSRDAFKILGATISGMAESRLVKFCKHVSYIKY